MIKKIIKGPVVIKKSKHPAKSKDGFTSYIFVAGKAKKGKGTFAKKRVTKKSCKRR